MTQRLFLFGSPRIETGGRVQVLPFERRSQLLVLLALKRGWTGRAELAAMFWPDQSDKLAYANLRKTLFRMQQVAWAGGVESQGGAVRLQAGCDVFDFEAALHAGRIADALPLMTGELLAGFDDDSSEAWSGWLAYERERLRTAWRQAALQHAADVDAAEGVALTARLLEADPLDEAALRTHLACLARQGQGTRARQAYRDFTERLQRELNLTPGTELKALHDSIASTLSAAPPAAAAAALATAPPSDAGFVGRAGELKRIAEQLAGDDCRLLCLIGPGGVGKTRLARRALAEAAPRYRDGAVFVPLEDLDAPGQIAGRLARELAGGESLGRGDPLERITAWLRPRRMLVVLDNFEHLTAATAMVDQLLGACPQLAVIVTSRVRLGSAYERLMPIEGLPCPEAEDADRIEAFDAARLFVKAAQRVEPGLIPAAEAPAIVGICRQLDGMPLALELAASWTRVLSCEAIEAELRQGTELLRAVDPAQPARHASIEVVFEQTWQLLGAAERTALARLSVFRGGFTPEAARAVAGASLPVLGALADKSLLRKDGPRQTRLQLHPLVQQLAAGKLVDDAAATAQAHGEHFLRLLGRTHLAVDHGEREALLQLDAEFENCRVAWQWAAENGAAELLARSVGALDNYCDHRLRHDDGQAVLEQAVQSPACAADPPLQALLMAVQAHMHYRCDRYAEAESVATRALALPRGEVDRGGRLKCFAVLGGCALRRGQLADARRFFRQVLRHSRASGDVERAAGTLDNLALVEKGLGNYDEVLRLSTESLALHRQLGDAAGVALCLNNLGAFCSNRLDFETAGVHLREALAICDHHGIISTRMSVLANLTEVALRTGDLDRAERYGEKALALARSRGSRYNEAWLKLQFARIALLRSDLAGARRELAEAMQVAGAIERPALQVDGIFCAAEVMRAQGAMSAAQRLAAYVAVHPAAAAPDREVYAAELAAWLGGAPPPPAADLPLAELVRRTVSEAAAAYAPLIAQLGRG